MVHEASRTEPGPGHEKRDIDVRKVVESGMGLVILVLVSVLGGLYFYGVLVRWTAPKEVEGQKLGTQAPALLFTPVDKTASGQELKELHQEEEQIIRHYGWLNKETGIAHIPIDCDERPCAGITGIDLLLQKGIPAQSAAEGTGPGGPTGSVPAAAEGTGPGGPTGSGPAAKPEAARFGESNGWSQGGAP